jgi:hypothetical protein
MRRAGVKVSARLVEAVWTFIFVFLSEREEEMATMKNRAVPCNAGCPERAGETMHGTSRGEGLFLTAQVVWTAGVVRSSPLRGSVELEAALDTLDARDDGLTTSHALSLRGF